MSPPPPQPLPRTGPARFADPGTAHSAAAAFDLRQLPADYFANPYPYYHALRETRRCTACPTADISCRATPTASPSTRTPGLSPLTKSASLRPKYGDGLLYEHHTTSLVFNDPPLHTRVRRIIAGAFTPRRSPTWSSP